MLQPQKTKFRKFKKSYLKKYIENTSSNLKHGVIGLKALSKYKITAKQIESLRQCITRCLRRQAKIWINVFPHISSTAKPLGSRMGKGKGSLNFWFAPIFVGTIILEIAGVNFFRSKKALEKSVSKLPFKCTFLIR